MTQVRYMKDDVLTPSWVEIFKKSILVVILMESPMTFVIRNKDTADSFRAYFDMMWGIGEKA